MALDDDIAILRRVALFQPLDSEQLRLLAFGAEQRTFAPGRALCQAGDRAEGALVLRSGMVTLTDEVDRDVGQADAPGTLIGETALFHRGTWQVTAIAESECMVMRVPRPLFRRILEEYPDTAEMLYAAMVKRLSTDIAAFERAARKLG